MRFEGGKKSLTATSPFEHFVRIYNTLTQFLLSQLTLFSSRGSRRPICLTPDHRFPLLASVVPVPRRPSLLLCSHSPSSPFSPNSFDATSKTAQSRPDFASAGLLFCPRTRHRQHKGIRKMSTWLHFFFFF